MLTATPPEQCQDSTSVREDPGINDCRERLDTPSVLEIDRCAGSTIGSVTTGERGSRGPVVESQRHGGAGAIAQRTAEQHVRIESKTHPTDERSATRSDRGRSRATAVDRHLHGEGGDAVAGVDHLVAAVARVASSQRLCSVGAGAVVEPGRSACGRVAALADDEQAVELAFSGRNQLELAGHHTCRICSCRGDVRLQLCCGHHHNFAPTEQLGISIQRLKAFRPGNELGIRRPRCLEEEARGTDRQILLALDGQAQRRGDLDRGQGERVA